MSGKRRGRKTKSLLKYRRNDAKKRSKRRLRARHQSPQRSTGMKKAD